MTNSNNGSWRSGPHNFADSVISPPNTNIFSIFIALSTFMTYLPYSYKRPHSERYIFTSIGKKKIEKVVDFVPIGIKNIMNLGFGDLLPDGSVDDTANSNNGDLIKVLATVIEILRHYTAEYPQVEVFFAGSTAERTKLYTRILKTYYPTFRKEYTISVVIGSEKANKRVPFDPMANTEYLGFLIKRID
jgi:hypothetical protein